MKGLHYGLEERVSLLGAGGPAEVRALLENSDCFILASLLAPDGDSDATPTVLGEAMAVGLPVISTRIAGIPEIVPENAGLLVAPGEVEPLAEAIATMAGLPPEQRFAMGGAAANGCCQTGMPARTPAAWRGFSPQSSRAKCPNKVGGLEKYGKALPDRPFRLGARQTNSGCRLENLAS